MTSAAPEDGKRNSASRRIFASRILSRTPPYLRNSGRFAQVAVVGHSEGGLVAILAARRVPVDHLVLLATAARKQGDLLKAQLERKQIPAEVLEPILKAIDDIMAGQIVDPPPRGLPIAPSMQPG